MTQQKSREVRRKRMNGVVKNSVSCWGGTFWEGISYTGSNMTEIEEEEEKKKKKKKKRRRERKECIGTSSKSQG
eukprot:13493161-Ditylum_brightwellii.AAC.1